MGMDVIGRNPKNKTGEYFRANVWSWRPIHWLCWFSSLSHEMETGEKSLIPDKTMDGMGHNQGDGLRSDRKCKLLAEWLEYYIEELFDPKIVPFEIESPRKDLVKFGVYEDGNFYIDTGRCYVDKEGVFLSSEKGKDPNIEKLSSYQTNKDHIQGFVDFLRNCGGFQVW
jgi:hypothetical protein